MKNSILIYLLILFISCSPRKSPIAILPYGNFDPILINEIAPVLEKEFHRKIIVLPNKELPKSAFVNIKIPRYRADSLLRELKYIKPDSIEYILGLTSRDISTTKRNKFGFVKEPQSKYMDWGIFGLGYSPGPSCIVSTYRLKDKNRKLFVKRLTKVCIHEIGHNFGLDHCTTERCVMQDAAESIKTIDVVDANLCTKCREELNLPKEMVRN